jgi:hypothetical protein
MGAWSAIIARVERAREDCPVAGVVDARGRLADPEAAGKGEGSLIPGCDHDALVMPTCVA